MKYFNFFVLFSVALIVLSGAATALSYTTDSSGQQVLQTSPPTFWDKITHFLYQNQFSIIGQDTHASAYPDKKINLNNGDAFNQKISSVCSSGNGLVDTYIYQGNALYPQFETAKDISWTCNTGGSGICIAEIYCMPHPFCTSNSNCVSWVGTGSQCLSKPANDPYITFLDSSNYNYCSSSCTGSPKTCYQLNTATNSCQSRVYDCSYSTYPSCPSTYPYTSQSACQADLAAAPAPSPTPSPTPNPTPSPTNQVSDIRATEVIWPESGFLTFQPALVTYPDKFFITLKNFGDKAGTVNIEAGFYSPDYAKNVAKLTSFSIFGLFSVVATPNCNPAESFVTTKQVTLAPGESQKVELDVNPKNALVTYGKAGTYDLNSQPLVKFWGIYSQCLGGYTNEAGTTGKGVMFGYADFKSSCSQFLQTTNVMCNDPTAGQIKIGTCSGTTLTLTDTCKITSTVDVILQNATATQTITSLKLTDAKKSSLTRDEISTSTNTQLFASSCLKSEECLSRGNYTTSCNSIDSLRKDGTLTQAKQDSFFADTNSILKSGVRGGAIGGAVGVVLCGATIYFSAGAGALACPAILGATAGIGALSGVAINTLDSSDSLLKAMQAKDASSVGICTAESLAGGTIDIGSFITGLGKTFKITGNTTTDGYIVLIGGLILLMILLNILLGGRK